MTQDDFLQWLLKQAAQAKQRTSEELADGRIKDADYYAGKRTAFRQAAAHLLMCGEDLPGSKE